MTVRASQRLKTCSDFFTSMTPSQVTGSKLIVLANALEAAKFFGTESLGSKTVSDDRHSCCIPAAVTPRAFAVARKLEAMRHSTQREVYYHTWKEVASGFRSLVRTICVRFQFGYQYHCPIVP